MKPEGARIGVAVIGLGVGEQHARAYLATGCCELRWLYDLNAARAESLARTLGGGTPAQTLEQILQDPEVDVVSIASYDDAHFAQTLAALEAGKHVFVEKPLCRTGHELRTLKAAWRRHQGRVKLSSNLVLRTAAVYQWLKQRIAAGDLGTPYAFDGDYLYGRLEKITAGWRGAINDYSVMHGGGIHLVDLMLWLLGERPATVYATGNRICTDQSTFRYSDYVAATLHCPSGMVGRITANFGCVHRHHHVVRLFGTHATFVCDDTGPRLHLTRDAATLAAPVTLPCQPATKGALIPPFVSAILTDENLDAHTQTLFDVISVCTACDKSLRSQAAVEVDYV